MLPNWPTSTVTGAVMHQDKCNCGCGRKFGLQRYDYYRMRFVSEECVRGYKARLSKDARDKIRELLQRPSQDERGDDRDLGS
jgi:hypothetical protein